MGIRERFPDEEKSQKKFTRAELELYLRENLSVIERAKEEIKIMEEREVPAAQVQKIKEILCALEEASEEMERTLLSDKEVEMEKE